MLTAAGCTKRRERLLQRVGKTHGNWIVLTDPVHLRYFANFHVDPFSLGAESRGVLGIHQSGRSVLIHDNVLPPSVQQAHVAEVISVPWYDCLQPAKGPRATALTKVAFDAFGTSHIADNPFDQESANLYRLIGELRRQKDDDEVAVLQACMKAGEAGHAWALANIGDGFTELEAYRVVQSECVRAAGQPAIVYGDFAVSDGPERMGGPPTDRVIRAGDLFILDFSVVLFGYRSDFTNTICIGGEPTSSQKRQFELCKDALAASESLLCPGQSCQAIYNAASSVFKPHDLCCPHHIGHGLGLTHPESPYFVQFSTESLLPGDVVTLEPGLYVSGVGGIRIEHNYLITETSFRRLSLHQLSLT